MKLRENNGVINVKQQANIVYRFALPKNASANQRRKFKRRIELMQLANPNLVLTPDWPQKDEDEAFIAFLEDKDYNRRRAAYLVGATLSRSLSGTYG